MDEKVIANLVVFFLLPSPALTIPFPSPAQYQFYLIN